MIKDNQIGRKVSLVAIRVSWALLFARLVLTYQLKVLLGIGSMNLAPAKLFRDVALMRLVGYTAAELRAGFCRRGQLAAGPMHKVRSFSAMART